MEWYEREALLINIITIFVDHDDPTTMMMSLVSVNLSQV
jgi:hypothetical protein